MAISKAEFLEAMGKIKTQQDTHNAATYLGIHAKADTAGAADSATTAAGADKLNTAVTINGVSFDGSANITINAEDSTARVAVSEKGAANGVATLDASSKIPSSQLPSYVDDVIEGYYNSTDGKFYKEAAFTTEITGEADKIYYDLAATVDGAYRWGGSAFVAVGTSVSNADKAVNDVDGNAIKTTYLKTADAATTYVAQEAGKSLMTSEQATQLASLVASSDEQITDAEIAALFA